MKILYYDGNLKKLASNDGFCYWHWPISIITRRTELGGWPPVGRSAVWINAEEGYLANIQALGKLLATNPDCTVVTNSVAALSNVYGWDKENNKPNIFIHKDGRGFVNIEKLYEGKMRSSQNIFAMYQSGVFGY